MDAGFLDLLKSDHISRRKTLQISHKFMQRLVVSILCQETKKHRNQKVGSEGTQLVARKLNMELRPELCP